MQTCPRCDLPLPETGTACPRCGFPRTLKGLMEVGRTSRSEVKALTVRTYPDLGLARALLALALNALVFPGLGTLLARRVSAIVEIGGFAVSLAVVLWALDAVRAGETGGATYTYLVWGILGAVVTWSMAVRDGIRLVRRATGRVPPPMAG